MKDVLTRSGVNEVLVEDINLYITNGSGDLVTHCFYEQPTAMEADIYKDMEYTLFVIANAGKSLPVKSVNEIENLLCQIDSIEDMVSDKGGVLMAGKTPPLVLSNGQNVEIGLVRCISKIVLKCNFDELDEDVNIIVKGVSLKNVPNSIYPFKENRIMDVSASIDGESVVSPSMQSLKDGIIFYQYENLQGTLQPDNIDQNLKVWPEGDVHRDICSFVELEAAYSSPRKRGEIRYRFYLGKDMTSNYDVVRNTQHSILVSFKGNGSVEETTWRVDNSLIEDLVTSISISPQVYKFDKWGETIQLSAAVLPATASDRRVMWASSNESVAIVDTNGKVISTGDGVCTITATSCDGTNISALATIEVDAKIPVTSIKLSETLIELHNGMTYSITATVYPANATNREIIWQSSNEDMVTVNANGVATGGRTLGNCKIYAISADNNKITAECDVIIRELEYVCIKGDREITIKVGESYQLDWYSEPYDAEVSFRSYNSPALIVDDYGVITGLKPTRTIVDIYVFGSRDQYYVTVVE